jgi:glycolate oxidase FAD binding subunit
MIEAWQARIKEAAARKTPLQLRGSGTKEGMGEIVQGEVFDTRAYAGVVAYEPSELVITVRCGTPLAEVEKTMHEAGQMLAFEAPYAKFGATIGGAFASGLSGPRRPYAGAVRDFVLGAEIIDGKGDYLRFGGQVMKNVAGFDVSRLQCGAWGTLGLVTQVSFKCLPLPKAQTTLRMEIPAAQFLSNCAKWASLPLPISAAAWSDGVARVRLSGAQAAVKSATEKLGGERADDDQWWADLRDQRLPFFTQPSADALWRLSVKATAPLEAQPAQLIDWSGAQRYVRAPAAQSQAVRACAEANGGHATLISKDVPGVQCFHPMQPALLAMHQRMKTTFDPYGIFNVGRLFAENPPSPLTPLPKGEGNQSHANQSLR